MDLEGHSASRKTSDGLEDNEVCTSEANTMVGVIETSNKTDTENKEIEQLEEVNDQDTVEEKKNKEVPVGQVNGDSGISMEKFGDSSDEESRKRRKLNVGGSSTSESEDSSMDNVARFNKIEKTRVKMRNYRSKRALTEEREDSFNDSSEDDSEDVEMIQQDKSPACLKKEKPKPKWFAVPELISREQGRNSIFHRRYYGSLHVVQRFDLMYKLEGHWGCVNSLNFNQRGNLLASCSDDLAVVIWDWAAGKKRHIFNSGHTSNVFQAKWLPFDVEYLMTTCARDGQVRLLDVRTGISRNIAKHDAPAHKLAVHPDTPYIIISAGEDARVLSIDIRDDKTTELVVVKDGVDDVGLYSVQSNPLNSNEFCVSGLSEVVRIYDRRKASTPLHMLCPSHLIGNSRCLHVTCAVYNHNGTEILATYNNELIYLFDAVSPKLGEYAHSYGGHCNKHTVKGVNFFGPKSEFVISGSDCSNIFIWDKETEAIVNFMPGDAQGVVNCLEPHPHIPILATSGLDFDVKIWVPSAEQPTTLAQLSLVTVKRLMREVLELHEATEEYCASPLEDNLFEWHFTVQGPPSTDFEGGVYHGRILLPPEYPMKPPNIILLTPNGRFEINKKICLSISGHHPETWQPSWSIRTALLALIAFMPTPGNRTIGSLDYSKEERQKLAKKSLNWQCDTCGKVVNLLSKTTAKKPITEEEQTMLNTIALKADDSPTSEPSFVASTADSVPENELRQRNVDTTSVENQDRQQSDVIVNQQVETMSSSNDLFWSILIASLVSAIILLVLRRLFLV
ncbi:DDB1- and CUL4-associated factor 8 [Dufourea novaeangliae]|uniref:DDB1-and CUL4-associated factor 8 n=1 Tax=Dufourea novaeangliae TaxID=178035 RepID=A0A154PD53_DUFNO|nr:DDB1- and CUL4-associated factor 8 [Dufourea novaeangliae]